MSQLVSAIVIPHIDAGPMAPAGIARGACQLVAPPLLGAVLGGVAVVLAAFHPAAPSGAVYWILAGAASGAIGGSVCRWASSWIGEKSVRADMGACMLAILPACIMAACLGGVTGSALDGSLGGLWLGALFG